MPLIHDRTIVDAPVLDILAERWSTRLFDGDAPLDEEALTSALEAARWAPSANNSQPWRFIVARRGTPAHAAVVSTLAGFNQQWAPRAGALVVVLAQKTRDDGTPLRWAEYDAGQAAAFFIAQAHASGLFAHQIGGYDHAAVADAFALDDDLTPLTVIAVGALGDADTASDDLRERETAPRTRRPVSELVLLDA
ncbi:nitroreductase family protein [Microbacterium sp. X-17]|uniref:nitroreductase family protein n=1 Tax=Microbacterium sp. X-17 TaxID=3144404 RepID=UPI0031F544A1